MIGRHDILKMIRLPTWVEYECVALFHTSDDQYYYATRAVSEDEWKAARPGLRTSIEQAVRESLTIFAKTIGIAKLDPECVRVRWHRRDYRTKETLGIPSEN